MLLGANHMTDLHCMVIDDAGQVIQATAIGTLDHVILLARPLHADFASHGVLNHALSLARHLQPNHTGSTFGCKLLCRRVVFRHPLPIVYERSPRLLRRLTLGLQLLGRRVIAVGVTAGEQLRGGLAVQIGPLGLEIGTVWPSHFRAFVPIHPQPTEAIENWLQSFLYIALLIGIVNPQNELPARLLGKNPVEQRRTNAANVQVTGRTGSKTCADHRNSKSNEGWHENVST